MLYLVQQIYILEYVMSEHCNSICHIPKDREVSIRSESAGNVAG